VEVVAHTCDTRATDCGLWVGRHARHVQLPVYCQLWGCASCGASRTPSRKCNHLACPWRLGRVAFALYIPASLLGQLVSGSQISPNFTSRPSNACTRASPPLGLATTLTTSGGRHGTVSLRKTARAWSEHSIDARCHMQHPNTHTCGSPVAPIACCCVGLNVHLSRPSRACRQPPKCALHLRHLFEISNTPADVMATTTLRRAHKPQLLRLL